VTTGPRVDVGIPTYGRPRFVVDAIESVLAQTLGEWRLLVAEDGVGDGPIADAVAPFLADPRVEYSPAGAHVGAAVNMNRVLAAGGADYVAILHDDDRWEPTFLERRVRLLDAHPACGLAFGEHLDIDGDGAVVGRSRSRLAPGVQDRLAFGREMMRANLVGTPTVVMRRSALAACGARYDESYRYIYDWELMLRLAQRFPTGYVREWDSCYRTHGAQISARQTAAAEFLRVFEEADARAVALGPDARLPQPERDRLRARLRMSVALDEALAGRRGDALRGARAALRLDPRRAASRPFAATMAAVALPAAGRRGVDKLRSTLFQRRIRPDDPAG
jgi:glycosyl transferase family 2